LPFRTRFAGASPITASYMATFFQRVLYIPTTTAIQIAAPTGPIAGDQFAVKNMSNLATPVVQISGNGYNIESAGGGYTLGSVFTLGIPGASLVWEHDGVNWNAV
jgi:hypothetical protein